MKIHQSYSKKDLVKIINENNINCIDLKLTRYDIIKELEKLEDKYDFKFLEKENNNKSLTIKQKNDIIFRAQTIISLQKNGFNFDKSFFNSEEQLFRECNYLANYGDISSVRRAIKFVNDQYHKNIKIKISNEVSNHLQKKEIIKKNSIGSFYVKKEKKYVVDFS